MADNNTIARPYARAAFEVAKAENSLDELSGSLNVAKALLADGSVAKFLANPSLSDDQRLAFIKELFAKADGESSMFAGGNKHGENFLKLLLEYGRIDVLPEIAEHFDALKAQVENTVDVTVTSAAELGDAQRNAIAAALKERLGRDINLSTDIDANLIGGAVIRAGDVVIDGSVRARLEGLSNALIS